MWEFRCKAPDATLGIRDYGFGFRLEGLGIRVSHLHTHVCTRARFECVRACDEMAAVCVSLHAQALPRPTMSTCVLESASRPCLPRSSSARWGETWEGQCPSDLV